VRHSCGLIVSAHLVQDAIRHGYVHSTHCNFTRASK
jgi:hypothetical protein